MRQYKTVSSGSDVRIFNERGRGYDKPKLLFSSIPGVPFIRLISVRHSQLIRTKQHYILYTKFVTINKIEILYLFLLVIVALSSLFGYLALYCIAVPYTHSV